MGSNIPDGAKAFKAFCVANNLSAKKIAEDCGVPIGTVYSYFQGTRTPGRKNMKVLSEKYGLNVYDLFINK
jgi:transcriptional regulator with XRE-family HTH domain